MLLTESRNPNTMDIDKLPTLEMLTVINREDQGVPVAVAKELPQIALAVEKIADAFTTGGRLIYVGAGTSGRLGVLDAVECPPTYGVSSDMVTALIAGGPGTMFKSSENCEDDYMSGIQAIAQCEVQKNDVVVGLSAAGSAKYVLGAMDEAKKRGATTVGFSCNPGSAVEQNCDIPITVITGPEVITGSTRMKAGTAEKLVLNMLTTGAMIRTGKVYENLMVNVQPNNIKLQERAISIVCQICGCDKDVARNALECTMWNVRQAIDLCN